jgi:hypothetical protein
MKAKYCERNRHVAGNNTRRRQAVRRPPVQRSVTQYKGFSQTLLLKYDLTLSVHGIDDRVASNAQYPALPNYLYLFIGARGGVVAKALRYKPAGRGFDSLWCQWNFSVT